MAEEKNFENRIKKFLSERGCWWVKFHGNGYTRSGVPDLLCSVSGVFVAIEVKAERGKPSPLQIHQINQINESGGVAVIVKPSQWNQLKILLNFLMDGEIELAFNCINTINSVWGEIENEDM